MIKKVAIVGVVFGAVVAFNVYHHGAPAPYVKPDVAVDTGKPLLTEGEIREIVKDEVGKAQ